MKYPCEIIKDLLPLYVDNIASEKSKNIVDEHLSECDSCKQDYEAMKSYENYSKNSGKKSEDSKLADGLKKIKKKINKKIMIIIACSVAAVILFIFGCYVLFSMPVKSISADDVSVVVDNYMLKDITHFVGAEERNTIEDDDIFTDNEGDIIYRTDFPGCTWLMTKEDYEESLKQSEYVAQVSIKCPYYYYSTNYYLDGNTVYIENLKTTLLDNKKSENMNEYEPSLELFEKIDKVVYVDGDKETVIWSEP